MIGSRKFVVVCLLVVATSITKLHVDAMSVAAMEDHHSDDEQVCTPGFSI